MPLAVSCSLLTNHLGSSSLHFNTVQTTEKYSASMYQGCTGQPFLLQGGAGRGTGKKIGGGAGVKTTGQGGGGYGVTVKLWAFTGWGGAGQGSLENVRGRDSPFPRGWDGAGPGVHPWYVLLVFYRHHLGSSSLCHQQCSCHHLGSSTDRNHHAHSADHQHCTQRLKLKRQRQIQIH